MEKPLTDKLKPKTLLIAIIFLVLGIVLLLFASIVSQNYWAFFGLLLITGFAACLSGIFLGFLFGIPKINKNYNPTADYKTQLKYEPNTNLEDISDWLTKIIVGISLTQIAKIPPSLQSIADYILFHSNCKFNCDYARPILISAIIYFFIAGFILGYISTRLLLPGLLDIFERNQKLANKNKELDRENSILIEGAKKEKDITSKLNSLTPDELTKIKNIWNEGKNEFTVQGVLSLNDFSIINVLLKKGFIVYKQGDTLRDGAILEIKDKDFIDHFKDDKKTQ